MSEVKNAIQAFIHHVESLEKSEESDCDGFRKEYTQIQEIQLSNQRNNVGSMDVGHMESNLKKNRYKDIVPYDDHRVVLKALDEDECSDYINASNIMGVTGTCDYIASQGPLSTTVNDFWRMIWEYNIEIVFMACRLIEMKKMKCSQYWSSVGTSQEFGDMTVFTETEDTIVTECVQRKFRVTKGEEVHYVIQFQYCGWPDHGIPENLGDIRDIIGIMRDMRSNSKAPVLIHCSAGCGRTGAIIAVDYAWTLLDEGKFDETFSLFKLICNLREQRVSLVQTPDQYALVNKMLKSLCEERLIKFASHIYENVIFNQDQSNVGNNQETAEENDYEDIWSQDAGSELKTSILNPKESSTTDERYLGKSGELKGKYQTLEQEIDNAPPVYANTAEIHRELQEDLPPNHEQPSEEKTFHKTVIRIDSVSSKKTKPPSKDVTEQPAESLTSSSKSSDLKERNPLTSAVHPNEATLTGHNEEGNIVRRGATKIKPKAIVATAAATSSPTRPAGTATSISTAKKEEPRSQSVRSHMPAQDASRVIRRHPPVSVRVGLPTSQLQKHPADADPAVRGFNRRWSSLKSHGSSPVPSSPLYQNTSSMNSRGTAQVPSSSLYQNTSLKSYANVTTTSSPSHQRTSSLRHHGTTPPPALSLYQKTAPAPRTEFYSVPGRKSMSLRVNPNNKVSDTTRLHDNTAVRSDNGATKGWNSGSGSHDNQHTRRDPRLASQAPPNYIPADIPKFGGFVRLNSRKEPMPDEDRQLHHK